jgi:hypothetical protein
MPLVLLEGKRMNFWNEIHAHLPIVVITLACLLAPTLQLIKKYVPALKGWKALAANFGIAVITVFGVTPVGQFWSMDAWSHVLAVTLGAAGLYGTSKSLLGKQQSSTNPAAKSN